ncbi:17209_t:CDS:2, partial [Gigaspora rosea]
QINEENGTEELKVAESMEIESLRKIKISATGYVESSFESPSSVIKAEDIYSSRWAPSSPVVVSTRRKEGPVEKRARIKTQELKKAVKGELTGILGKEPLGSQEGITHDGTKMQDIQETSTNNIIVAEDVKESLESRTSTSSENNRQSISKFGTKLRAETEEILCIKNLNENFTKRKWEIKIEWTTWKKEEVAVLKGRKFLE